MNTTRAPRENMTPNYTDVWLCVDCTHLDPHRTFENDADLTMNVEPDGEHGFTLFSKSPCDYCGSKYAGSRYRYALWTD